MESVTWESVTWGPLYASPFLGLTLIGIGLQILGFVCLLFYIFKKAPRIASGPTLPGVTILKPCARAMDGELENFRTFFEQKYEGPLQILFVVSSMTDPIVPLVRDMLKRYPNVDAELILSTTRKACWPKTDALYDGQQVAKHDIVIWSDSDAVVREDYVHQVVEALSEKGVSVVTIPQLDAFVDNFPTALKALGNNADVFSYMMIYNAFTRAKDIAYGHSIAFRRSEFAEFEEEAWHCLNTHLADDLELPKVFTRHGRKVVHRNIYCPVRFSGKSLSQVFRQQEKFTLCQRSVTGRWTYLLGVLVFPQLWAAFYVLTTGYSDAAVSLFFLVWALRAFISLVGEAAILGSVRMTLRWFWVIPLWDILHLYFNLYAFFQDKIVFGGKVYEFKTVDTLQARSE